LYRKKKKKNGD